MSAPTLLRPHASRLKIDVWVVRQIAIAKVTSDVAKATNAFNASMTMIARSAFALRDSVLVVAKIQIAQLAMFAMYPIIPALSV